MTPHSLTLLSLDCTITWHDSSVFWLYYCVTRLLTITSHITWRHNYLTCFYLTQLITWLLYSLTLRLLDSTVTLLLLESTISWLYCYVTTTWLCYSFDSTITRPCCIRLHYDLIILLFDSTITWLYYYLTPLLLDSAIFCFAISFVSWKCSTKLPLIESLWHNGHIMAGRLPTILAERPTMENH